MAAVKLWFDEWTGYTLGQPKVVLWGGVRRSLGPHHATVHRLAAWLRGEKVLPSDILSREIMDKYIDRINRVRPVQLLGYAGAAHEVACHVKRSGRAVRPQGR